MPATVNRHGALALADYFARDRAELLGAAETARQGVYTARAALRDAEAAEAEAIDAAKATEGRTRELARALAWVGSGVIAESGPDPEYGTSNPWGIVTRYAAAFGGATVTNAPRERGAAPKGRAYVWRRTPNGGRETVAEWTPKAGTRDPDKLAAQVADADVSARLHLADLTAEAWLMANGIDPETAPTLAEVATLECDAERRGYGADAWARPVWRLLLGSEVIATIDDRRDILSPAEAVGGGAAVYASLDDILGPVPEYRATLSDTGPALDAIRRYAESHADRARGALLHGFYYQPERGR